MVDHVSDSFLEPDAPLHLLIAAAKEGNEKEVDEHAQVSSRRNNVNRNCNPLNIFYQ